VSIAPASIAELVRTVGEERARVAARHACWRRGDLTYLLHDGQQAALDAALGAEARRFVLCTGRRWGKSRLMCVLAANICALRIVHRSGGELPPWLPPWLEQVVTRTTKPARVVYAAPTAGMVAEFIDPHMRLIASHAPAEMRPESKGGDWHFPDGSRVVIKGCEDRKKADRLRGAEADHAIADEGGFIPILDYVVRDVLGPQLWETRGRLWLPSTPPESPDHPFVAFLAEAEERGAAYRARTADAPHISPQMLAEAIDDAGGEDSIAWQREGEARILRDPAHVVLPEWPDDGAGVVEERERPRYFVPMVVGDLGYVDLTVIGFGYYDFAAGVDVLEDELVFSHTRSDAIDAAVEAKERELWGDNRAGIRRHIDAQPITRADMGRAGFGASEGEPGETWLGVRKDERDAAVNALRIRVKRRQLRVHPRCVTTIAHAKFGRWNTRRSDFERPANGGHHYDGLAMLVYFTRMLDRVTNPYPALEPGVSDASHLIYHDHVRPTRAQKIQQIMSPRRARR